MQHAKTRLFSLKQHAELECVFSFHLIYYSCLSHTNPKICVGLLVNTTALDINAKSLHREKKLLKVKTLDRFF